METITIPSFASIIIQPKLSDRTAKSNKIICRLGWSSFILGACAFFIHYISLNYLANFSPFNAGLITGFFLMIAGLASIAASYHETSYKYHLHAQIWSFIVDFILAPGLILVAIAALIVDSQDIYPICQSYVSPSRVRSSEFHVDYSSDILCVKVTNLYNLTRILNIIQLIIGMICFVIHIFLLTNQQRVIKQIKITENSISKEMIIYPQPNSIKTNQIINEIDLPPKYEDLYSLSQTISK
ncbi:hypothetical protein I4U23_006535 [Adineta vaga]|nr:hypothetical protein I4U23_006535 [Adineta vaga]